MNSLGFDKPEADTRVVVAMSGGVDSSVVAALLAEAGYETIGVTLQLYDHGAATHRAGACCAGQDIHDARRVADRLAIPHYVLDYESRFREAVIERFADSYIAGETPIPCVECNKSVKFRDLLDTARDLGADALATGHYVVSRVRSDGRRALYRASDSARDQSYFLYGTTQDQLDMLRFPLGELSKARTRDLARKYELPVAEKHDSQDICFVPNGRYADVIAKLRPEAVEHGDIEHIDGRVLGRHEGIVNFTVGQRRGLGVATGEPLFVVKLDPATRRVIVGPRDALATRILRLRDVNWLGDQPLADQTGDRAIAVRVRSTRPPAPALLRFDDGAAIVELAADEIGVARGQACVFYDNCEDGARVLGGGVIAATARASAAEPACAA
ncbi:MAG: tRNA 2-thiouridine(34) synthase MnmA [Rhizobiales bacterium 65-9]|nr:tRNA 2-thiouridine(34) synthase MnmA [Hyphomicrobiales bacterium]OJY39242.1 MAG: tRNA 2-thiouridine(34) synthase MnmA [Rhizobiales bacterium 65-9]